MTDLANDEMTEGYLDGFDPTTPAPNANRTASYCHGWENGRADREHRSRGRASDLRAMADHAAWQDANR